MLPPLPARLLLSGKRATAFIAEVVSAVSDISQLYSVFGDEALSTLDCEIQNSFSKYTFRHSEELFLNITSNNGTTC